MIYDYQTGGCRDGLHADGPNLNQGAESTLSWLISLLTAVRLERTVAMDEAEEAPVQSAAKAAAVAAVPTAGPASTTATKAGL
jgi:hypothetical protein